MHGLDEIKSLELEQHSRIEKDAHEQCRQAVQYGIRNVLMEN